MNTYLTKKQIEYIRHIASLDGEVRLYKETSLSGKSETLRYSRKWIEHGRWGPYPRSESHMILSVKIKLTPERKDDPNDWERYNRKCAEAQRLFDELRKH